MTGKVALVVDPEPMVLDVARQFFEDLGYEVRTARSVQEALSRAQAGPIDVAFIECHLKDDSQALAKQLRFKQPKLPIIFTTGHDLDAFVLFREPVLLKPYSFDQLRETIPLARDIADALPSLTNLNVH